MQIIKDSDGRFRIEDNENSDKEIHDFESALFRIKIAVEMLESGRKDFSSDMLESLVQAIETIDQKWQVLKTLHS